MTEHFEILADYSNVKRVTFSTSKNIEDNLNVTIFMNDGFHHSFSVNVKDNKLKIGEGFGYCPYIPNLPLK